MPAYEIVLSVPIFLNRTVTVWAESEEQADDAARTYGAEELAVRNWDMSDDFDGNDIEIVEACELLDCPQDKCEVITETVPAREEN